MPNIPLPDECITIEERYQSLIVKNGKLPKARLMWQGGGLSVYVKGSLKGLLYESAINLAINAAIARNIPCVQMRKVSR